MASVVLEQLERYGPHRCEKLSYEGAAAYTQRLAASHYENFSVVSMLVPRRLRDDFANVYAFCRWADDLGDETGDREQSLELLTWWRRELERCYADDPRHPVFVALHETVNKHDIPITPFRDLIDAFVQDQRVTRYDTWDRVLDYCTRSADPVGRLVLLLCGYRDHRRQLYSDRTCTALQLVNFWQDVRRDILERDRIYVPSSVLGQHGLTHADLIAHAKGEKKLVAEAAESYRRTLRDLVSRTRPLFEEGRKLWQLLDAEARLPVQLFSMGGEAVIRGIQKVNYETLDRRPVVGKATKLRLMGRALLGRIAPSFFLREPSPA